MGNCASNLNCTVTHQPIESDPDIAGIGVLVSFGATAVITFIAIVVGYLTDSLPDSTLTELDRACIAKLQWRPWESAGPLGTLLKYSVATVAGVIFPERAFPDQQLDPGEKRKRDRARRSKGLERFVLALSDQQLVTGLAVLIAGYTNRCSRSFYHFQIIAVLGWFSSTTHLSTLAVLRAYLIDHPRVRDWRVTAMLAIFGLLVVSQAGTFSPNDSSLPMQCVFKDFAPKGLNFLSIINLTLVILFLCVSYANRTRRLYTFDPDWSFQDWIVEVLARPLIRKNDVRNLERIVVTTPTLSKAEQGATYRKLQQRRRWWKYCNDWIKNRSALSRRVIEIWYLNQEMQRSFLSEILTLLFGVSYGISQVITNRNQVPNAGLSGNQNDISFGQLVPLFLIALPVLAAGEIYYERHDEVGKLRSSQTFVAQLNPATLMLQDDTNAAVETTLRMAADSKAGVYSNSAAPSRQATDHQSGVLVPGADSGIPLSEMTGSAVRSSTSHATVMAADRQGNEPIIAAADDSHYPAMRRADTESGGGQMDPPMQPNFIRASSRKTKLLVVMFTIQAAVYIFLAVTLAGVGAAFLSGIPAIISFLGSAVAVMTVLMNFGVQVKEAGPWCLRMTKRSTCFGRIYIPYIQQQISYTIRFYVLSAMNALHYLPYKRSLGISYRVEPVP